LARGFSAAAGLAAAGFGLIGAIFVFGGAIVDFGTPPAGLPGRTMTFFFFSTTTADGLLDRRGLPRLGPSVRGRRAPGFLLLLSVISFS